MTPDGGGSGGGGSPTTPTTEGGSPAESETVPSPGCALANATVTSTAEFVDTGLLAYLTAPPGYDGVTPVPMILMLHATNQQVDYRNLTSDPAITEHYFLAAPRALARFGDNFESVSMPAGSQPDVLTNFLNEVLAKYCVDERRLFAVGNGSGARAVMRWAAKRDKVSATPRFQAVALVGTYDAPLTRQPIPLLFLHPLFSSNSRGLASDADGMKAFEILARINACGETTTPRTMAGCEARGMTVNPGCSDVQGCAAPLRFCHHDSPDEQGDPWPCFGSAAIAEFFEDYRR